MSGTTLLSDFLGCLHVKHTPRFADRLYNEAPYSDTVNGFRNLLAEYSIGSQIVRTGNDGLKTLRPPFVVQLHGQLAIVTRVGRRGVTVRTVNGKSSVATGDFTKSWNGAAIIATPGPDAAEPSYGRNRRLTVLSSFRRLAIPLCLITLTGWFFYINRLWTDVGICLLIFLAMIGIYACVMLVGKQLHISGHTADAVCGFLRKGGCQTILDTKASKIFGIIGWGEVGLAYFSVTLAALVFYPSSLPYLAFFNACCLPYTVWSITYQKFKARSWCTLCVIVQTLQWLMFASYLIAGAWNGFLPLRPDIIVLGIGYLLALMVIDRLIPVISRAVGSRSLETAYNNLRLRRSVFDINQALQPDMSGAENASSLIFGNPDSDDTVVICNDTLSPEASVANRQAGMLIMRGYRVIYVFADPAMREDSCPERLSLATQATRMLTGVYLSSGPDKAWEVFNRWYDSRRDSLAPFDGSVTVPPTASRESDTGITTDTEPSDPVGAEISRQQAWAKGVCLYASPSFIFNGKLLSDIYQPADLLYLY